MPARSIVRPIVRSFNVRFAANAARHVRAGGHAVVWDSPKRARLVLPVPREGDMTDLAYWALLDLALDDWSVETRGTFKGLATRKVPRDCVDIVRRRAERDSVFPGPTRRMRLDCLACGACCKANEVVLEDADFPRFEAAGLAHLTKRPWAKRRDDGRTVLVLARDKRCKHLLADNKCDAYAARPNACREFPAGSECCLYSREEELGLTDGHRERA
jgi:uncharacterized protein